MALSDSGELRASCSVSFSLEGMREEQSPRVWWQDLVYCLRKVVSDLAKLDIKPDIAAISVTSTSGTMIALDEQYEPLGPAWMYSDPRSHVEAEYCKSVAKKIGSTGYSYTSFNASSGLPKILWFVNQYPEKVKQTKLWVHAADYIIGKLSGVWGVTDYTNCLKTGYDLVRESWPVYISEQLGVPSRWLPKVVAPGTVLGKITPEAAELTGLPGNVHITTGMTDGCASQIASGAIRPGDWNTTIGTTMVVKGVTIRPIDDPLDRVYNHKHPQGYWMPGGASNTGGDWVSRDYTEADLDALNRSAEALIPTPWISYPLMRQGERFPFLSEIARGFEPQGLTPVQRFASRMEGVAYLERLSYEMIQSLSGEKVTRLYTAGGASKSITWLNIRSSVMGMPIFKMKHTEGAAGAAVLAASQTLFSGVEEAGSAMIVPELTVEPASAVLCEQYEERYRLFVSQLTDKGYINKGRGSEGG
jgi:sugar (pentulose or hexulose) kinase